MNNESKGIVFVVGLWLAGVAFNLALVGVIVWAAVHFIHKYW